MDRRAQAANYLIDTDHGVIVDVEATRAIRQAEVGAAQTMIERTETRFGMKPDSLVADSAYGSAESLDWLVRKAIKPFIPVLDRSSRTDGTFSRGDFAFDPERDRLHMPGRQRAGNWIQLSPIFCRGGAAADCAENFVLTFPPSKGAQ